METGIVADRIFANSQSFMKNTLVLRTEFKLSVKI